VIDVEKLRELVDFEAMNIDQPLSPNIPAPRQNNNFETPPRPHRSEPQCPDAPKRKSREEIYQDDPIYPISSVAAVPLFPFEGFERVDSEDTTIPVPRRLFDLEPKFIEPTLVEEFNNPTGANVIVSDEEREPAEEEKEDEDVRQNDE
jgi:hypothetical protein